MGILDRIFGVSRSRDDIDRIESVQVGENGGGKIYSEDVVEHILSELERRRDERVAYELQWTLNADFLAGHQNCDIDMTDRKIRTELGVERGEPERRVYNRIAPLMETRQANLGAVDYRMIVNPRTAELDDYAKARVSTKLLEYDQSITGFNEKKDKLIAWAELIGTAYTLSFWNTSLGAVVGKREHPVEDENGTVTTVYEDIHEGEIDFGLVSAYEVFPASLTIQEISDQPSIILEQVRDVDTVYDLYGLRVEGENVEHYVLTPMEKGSTGRRQSASTLGLSRETRQNAVKVITYLENPSRDYPEGRLITIIRDKIVYYGNLPGGIMPLVDFKSKTVAGCFFGKSVIQDLIPLQRAYNRVVNKIHDYINTMANLPWLIPRGSVDNMDEIEANGIESGSTIIFDPQRGTPRPVEYPDPPSVVLAERAQISSDMEYTAGVSQLMVVGATPSGVTSGTAIDNLRQIDSTRMSLTADNIRLAVIRMAKIWLRFNKYYSRGYRVLRITGEDESGYVYTWESGDINSYDIEFTAENELRYGKDQQRADFLQAYQLGLFADENGRIPESLRRRAWELFRVGEIANVTELDDLQRKNADRENAYLEQGVIPERSKYDDDEIHLETHLRHALSDDFRMLEKKAPEYAQKFDEHMEIHRSMINQRIQSAQAQAMQAAMNNGRR